MCCELIYLWTVTHRAVDYSGFFIATFCINTSDWCVWKSHEISGLWTTQKSSSGTSNCAINVTEMILMFQYEAFEIYIYMQMSGGYCMHVTVSWWRQNTVLSLLQVTIPYASVVIMKKSLNLYNIQIPVLWIYPVILLFPLQILLFICLPAADKQRWALNTHHNIYCL